MHTLHRHCGSLMKQITDSVDIASVMHACGGAVVPVVTVATVATNHPTIHPTIIPTIPTVAATYHPTATGELFQYTEPIGNHHYYSARVVADHGDTLDVEHVGEDVKFGAYTIRVAEVAFREWDACVTENKKRPGTEQASGRKTKKTKKTKKTTKGAGLGGR